MKTKNVITCLLAFAVGAATGWFAAGVGRAVAPRPPQSVAAAASMAVSMKPPSAVKPKRKARAKPVPEVSAAKTAKSKPVRLEAVQSATTGDSAETPKSDGVDAEKKAKDLKSKESSKGQHTKPHFPSTAMSRCCKSMTRSTRTWVSVMASSAGAQGKGSRRRSEPRRAALDGEGDYMISFATETTVNETRVSFNAVV